MPAAARQGGDPARASATRSRSPIPTIPRCGWHPPRPRAASAPGTVQAASAATISCRREVVPRRRARSGIHYRLGTIGAGLGPGEPVIIRAVAAGQCDTGARHRRGTGAPDVMPWLDWLHPGLCVCGSGHRLPAPARLALSRRVPWNALLGGIWSVDPAVTPIAGHGGEGDRQEPRPGRSGCRRGPRSTSRSSPTAPLPAPG